MGEITIKRWQCDRCRKIESKRPRCTPVPSMTAEYYWPEGPGPSFTWKEVCQPCSEKLRKAVDDLMADAELDKSRAALATLATLEKEDKNV